MIQNAIIWRHLNIINKRYKKKKSWDTSVVDSNQGEAKNLSKFAVIIFITAKENLTNRQIIQKKIIISYLKRNEVKLYN